MSPVFMSRKKGNDPGIANRGWLFTSSSSVPAEACCPGVTGDSVTLPPPSGVGTAVEISSTLATVPWALITSAS